MTALVTPFVAGAFDEEAFRMHIERQILAGVQGIVPAGTTGEAATLSFAEHKRVIEVAVDQAQGRVAVIAGTGSNNTQESIELTQAAKDLGADAALLISPYYNKPSQEGIYQHYKAVADAVSFPQILYNVPGRTNSNLSPETVARLAKVDNIVAIKDATADMEQLTLTMALCDDQLVFLSGDDATVLPFMAIGGMGVISVVSNLVPRSMVELTTSMRNYQVEIARDLHFSLKDLNAIMFVESNPVPVKAACAMLGWMRNELRLPLVPLAPQYEQPLRQALIDFDSGFDFLVLNDDVDIDSFAKE